MARAEVSPTAVYSDFTHAFPELATGPGVTPRGAAAARDREVRETMRRVIRQGWETATIVNLNPFQLDLNMGPLGHLTVPAKKTGELYALKVVDQPRFSIKDLGDDKVQAIPVFPKEMAEDLVKNYVVNNEVGGIFWYMGTGEVPKDHLEKAKEAQINWYYRLHKEGNANWSRYRRDPTMITDRMRDAAKELWRLKLINEQPEWITVTRSESGDQPCEGCGTVIPKIAAFCPNCHTIYNPDWVKQRRPDIWKQQGGDLITPAVARTDASSTERPPIEKYIEEEEAAQKAEDKEADKEVLSPAVRDAIAGRNRRKNG